MRLDLRMRKLKTRKELYTLAIMLLVIVVVITILPAVFDGARIVFRPEILKILHGLLSLLVAIVTFGIIGDSDALVKSDNIRGFAVQVGGSAAGFVIFFYLLTSGLSPYTSLSLSLIDSENRLITDKVRVTLSAKTLQFGETSTGFLNFPFLPKEDEARRVNIISEAGRSWKISKIDPESCKFNDQKLRGDCDAVEITLKTSLLCLESKPIISLESVEINTTLETVLGSLKEAFQKVSPDLNARLTFSSDVLKSRLHKEEFKLNRKIDSPRDICEHLSSIVGRFNRSKDSRAVRSYVSCNTILIATPSEDISEDFKPCTEAR